MFKRLRVVAVGVVAVLAAAVAQGQDAAERAALANAKILDINARILDIVGVTRGVDSVMKELGAKVTAQEIKIELSADVLFDFDKFDLKAQATDSLTKVAAVIKAYPKAPLLIEGHTDSKGAHAYNVSLSEKRAAAVKTWLVQNAGVDPARIATSGWGETKSAAPNTLPNGADNPEGRQKNRRVDITLQTR